MTHAALQDLLPCPFCGATPTNGDIRADESQGTKWGGVICPGCGVAGPEVRTGYEPVDCWADEAITAWNTRTALSAMEGEAVAWLCESDRLNLLKDGCCTVYLRRQEWAITAPEPQYALYTAPPPQQAGSQLARTKHVYWGAGEPECPKDIKADNGELHTRRCKVCGLNNPKTTHCNPDAEEDAYVIDKLARLLAEIAIALKGPEPPLTRWSYHDLPQLVRELVATHPTPSPGPQGEVVVTTDESGRCVMVSRQDDEHRVLSVIWEVGATPPQPEAQVSEAMVERAIAFFWSEFPENERDEEWWQWARQIMRETLTAALTTSGRDGDG